MAFYLAGLLILALGLTLNTKTGLGVTPIISVPYSIAQVFGFNFRGRHLGGVLFIVAIQFLLKGKPVRWADLLPAAPEPGVHPGAEPAGRRSAGSAAGDAREAVPAGGSYSVHRCGSGHERGYEAGAEPRRRDCGGHCTAHRPGAWLYKNWFDTVNVGITLVFGLVMGHPLCGIGLGTVLAMLGWAG